MRYFSSIVETCLAEATMDLLKLMKWEKTALKVGDHVEARWTNSGMQWSGKATVAKINSMSIVVTLDHEVGSGTHKYPAGQKISLPGSGQFQGKWSWNNTVLPLDRSEISK